MRNVAEFMIIGRIGSIKTVGSTLRVVIAANYPYKDAHGKWIDDPHWNEITIFSDKLKGYIEKHAGKGCLVHARGRIRQNSYEKNGERVYTVDLICNQFAILTKPQESDAAPEAETSDTEVPY